MRKILGVLIVVLAFGYAGVSVYRSRPVKIFAAPPAPPPKPNFSQAIAGVGLIEAASENISLSLPVSGLVTNVFVKAGDAVKRGEKLFELDVRDLRAELAVRRAAVEVAKRRLFRLERSPRPEDVPPAEARVREAQATLNDATVQLQFIESVSDKRAIRGEDLERRRIAVQSAEAKLAEAKAQLTLLKAGTWTADLETARAEVTFAEAQCQRIEADIERMIVRSPINATVLQMNVHPGEYAAAGEIQKPLALLGDVSELCVRVDIDEYQSQRITAAATAEGSLRGEGDVRIPLEFVRFEPYVVPKKSLTGESVERVDTRVLQVIYRIKSARKKLYVGRQMDVFIAVEGEKK